MGSGIESSKPHSFCMQLFVSFVDHCIQQQRFAELERLGVPSELIQRLDRLPASARADLAQSSERCFELRIHTKVLFDELERVETNAEQRAGLQACIAQGAPYEMIKFIYDTPLREFRRYRKLYNVPADGMRVTDDPEIVGPIEIAWEAGGRSVSGETFLAISEQTGATLRIVWAVLGPQAISSKRAPSQRRGLQRSACDDAREVSRYA